MPEESIRSNPIERWLGVLKKIKGIDSERAGAIIESDNRKPERLEELSMHTGLPVIRYFRIDGSDFSGSNPALAEFFGSDDLFAFRAVPKDASGGLGHQRRHGITKEECVSAISGLPGGPGQYSISLNGFFRTEYCGTIVSDGESAFVEMTDKDHLKLSQHDLPGDRIFRGVKLQGNELAMDCGDGAVKDIAAGALGHVERKAADGGLVRGYFEFLYNQKKGYAFIDYNDTDFHMNLNPRTLQEPQQPKAGDAAVSGAVACRGSASGRAVVIKSAGDFGKFEEGSVIIARMLTPEMVPLMSKAGAVVSDLGGITSHAAIVSRELGVACIVGARNATETFKDGDFVHVDGTLGTARKIDELK